MNNNNTLCVSEWQSFGVDDICKSLRGSGEATTKQSIKSKEIDCHESANADSHNDDKDSPSLAEGDTGGG